MRNYHNKEAMNRKQWKIMDDVFLFSQRSPQSYVAVQPMKNDIKEHVNTHVTMLCSTRT